MGDGARRNHARGTLLVPRNSVKATARAMPAPVSARVSLVMPQLGESIVEGTLVKWVVAVGSSFPRGAVIAEVETDKATSEIFAPVEGSLAEVVVREGSTVEVGSVLAWIQASAPPTDSKPQPPAPESAPTAAEEGIVSPSSGRGRLAPRPRGPDGQPRRSSPAVRRLARIHGIELEGLEGTGDRGRVTRDDLLAHVAKEAEAASPPAPGPAPETRPRARSNRKSPAVYSPQAEDVVEPFSRRRALIADRMSESLVTAAHVAAVTEVDMHKVLHAKAQDALHPSGSRVKLTLTAYIVHALARSLAEHPRLNASVRDRELILRAERNIGVAVDAPSGLVVPVVHRADELDLVGVARRLGSLVDKAQSGQLSAADLGGGSFTLSNPGRDGNLFGISIIRQPEVAILRTGSIVKRAVVREMDGEDVIVVRPMMYAALSYDHRVLDGGVANAFLRTWVNRLESMAPRLGSA